MPSTLDLRASLRRIKPDRWHEPLRRRAALPFVTDDVRPADIGPIMLDSCVYLDAAKGKLTTGARRLVAASHLFHCSVCVGELVYAFGRLDPTHQDTPATLGILKEILDRVRTDRTVTPDRNAYIDAGLITGTLVRTQGLGKAERRKLMFDALVFLTARRSGFSILTANVNDFDLIQQLVPDGKVVFYKPV